MLYNAVLEYTLMLYKTCLYLQMKFTRPQVIPKVKLVGILKWKIFVILSIISSTGLSNIFPLAGLQEFLSHPLSNSPWRLSTSRIFATLWTLPIQGARQSLAWSLNYRNESRWTESFVEEERSIKNLMITPFLVAESLRGKHLSP